MDEIIDRRFVTRDGDFSNLLDFPPEYRRYRDEGCKVARSCLDCPFAGCLEESFHGKDTSNIVRSSKPSDFGPTFCIWQFGIHLEFAALFSRHPTCQGPLRAQRIGERSESGSGLSPGLDFASPPYLGFGIWILELTWSLEFSA